MGIDAVVSLVVAGAVLAYLVYALLAPSRF